jgi:hypothetical protein
VSLQEFPGALDIRSNLRLRGVAIDGEVAARLQSYETSLTRLVYMGLSDFDRSQCASDFDKGTLTAGELRATARGDLKALLGFINDQRAADEANRPDYM